MICASCGADLRVVGFVTQEMWTRSYYRAADAWKVREAQSEIAASCGGCGKPLKQTPLELVAE